MSADAPQSEITKKRSKGKTPEYGTYLKRVFDQLDHHQDGCQISNHAMWTINDIVADFQKRLIERSLEAVECEGKSTLYSKHAKAATQLLCSGELLNCALEHGTRAVERFQSSA